MMDLNLVSMVSLLPAPWSGPGRRETMEMRLDGSVMRQNHVKYLIGIIESTGVSTELSWTWYRYCMGNGPSSLEERRLVSLFVESMSDLLLDY